MHIKLFVVEIIGCGSLSNREKKWIDFLPKNKQVFLKGETE